MTNPPPGQFITLEGGEGLGKTTQAKLLAKALEPHGIATLTTREPGGSHGAEAIRSILLDNQFDWSPRAESMLFSAARADHLEKTILPALAKGKWVICDRFLDSTRAYQGVVHNGRSGITDDDLLSLHRIGAKNIMPDLTLLLDLPEDDIPQIERRLMLRDGAASDRIGSRPANFHQTVRALFRQVSRSENYRFERISALGSIDDVHARIVKTINARFNLYVETLKTPQGA